jgi:hypothetical protein
MHFRANGNAQKQLHFLSCWGQLHACGPSNTRPCFPRGPSLPADCASDGHYGPADRPGTGLFWVLERGGPAKHVSRRRLTLDEIAHIATSRRRTSHNTNSRPATRMAQESSLYGSSHVSLVPFHSDTSAHRGDPAQRVLQRNYWTPACSSETSSPITSLYHLDKAITPGRSSTSSSHLQALLEILERRPSLISARRLLLHLPIHPDPLCR